MSGMPTPRAARLVVLFVIAAGSARFPVSGQAPRTTFDRTTSELRDTVDLFTTDRASLFRRYTVSFSPTRHDRLRVFYSGWQTRLHAIAFDRLSHEGRIDYLLLDNLLRHDLEVLGREDKLQGEMLRVVPVSQVIMGLEESRRRMENSDPKATARTLATMARSLDSMSKVLLTPRDSTRASGEPRPSRILAYRTASHLTELRGTLEQWYRYYAGYDPDFTWWSADPYRKADSALKQYTKTLRERVVGYREGEDEPIVGDPIGADAIKGDLNFEMISYTLEELIAIAEEEFAWCEREAKRAARDMGFGDDWRAALEKVKTLYVEPGKQPGLVRDLANEAIEFVESRHLLTVPPLAKEIWRMEMMSPAAQKTNPFFLGGEVIQVSYPTDGMAEEEKLMSLRGNNIHFARATVHHELIPGHHLQGFMMARYNPHRQVFATPFWTEGWSLYWEMLLWDLGFPKTPENRVGMLFWRMHRAARIIFSLKFHLGTMTPTEAIDFLVTRVGHERANATAEVRRSFNGSYSPLYQVAYMIGGLEFRALHRELVESGKMTDREFHDAVLQGGNMPVAMVRARLTGERLERDKVPIWRFAPSRR